MKNEIKLLDESVVDVFVLYQFVKKLTTPFNQWPAYQLGIIDKDGKVLRKRASLSTQSERNSFTVFDVLVKNIKKAIESLPGGKSRLATYAAGLYLMREGHNAEWYADEEMAYESFLDLYEEIVADPNRIEEIKRIEKVVLRESKDDDTIVLYYDEELYEDAPVNSVAGGGVAGLTVATGGPVVRKRKKKKVKTFREYDNG